jgi:hypothetical protein
MQTRAHIPPTGRWANLEQLLLESKPPTPGPFHGSFRQWSKNMRPMSMKEQVIAILNLHGIYDPAVVTDPSRLLSMAKHLKQEMDDAEAVWRAALDAKHICQEARQCKKVHQEGALGALPQGYGIKAPPVCVCVSGLRFWMGCCNA